MNKVQQYKKHIWLMLQRGEWSTGSLLSKNNKTNNKAWNIAITDAQIWAKAEQKKSKAPPKVVMQNIIKSSNKKKPLRKNAKVDIETLEAIKNIEKRKKQISRSKPLKNRDNFRSSNTYNKKSYKRFADEGLSGTRDDNKKMRAKQSGTNSYNKQ